MTEVILDQHGVPWRRKILRSYRIFQDESHLNVMDNVETAAFYCLICSLHNDILKLCTFHKQYSLKRLEHSSADSAAHRVTLSSVQQDCIWNEFTLKTCVKFSDRGADLPSALRVLPTKTVMTSAGASEGCGPAMMLTHTQDLTGFIQRPRSKFFINVTVSVFFLLNAI